MPWQKVSPWGVSHSCLKPWRLGPRPSSVYTLLLDERNAFFEWFIYLDPPKGVVLLVSCTKKPLRAPKTRPFGWCWYHASYLEVFSCFIDGLSKGRPSLLSALLRCPYLDGESQLQTMSMSAIPSSIFFSQHCLLP